MFIQTDTGKRRRRRALNFGRVLVHNGVIEN